MKTTVRSNLDDRQLEIVNLVWKKGTLLDFLHSQGNQQLLRSVVLRNRRKYSETRFQCLVDGYTRAPGGQRPAEASVRHRKNHFVCVSHSDLRRMSSAAMSSGFARNSFVRARSSSLSASSRNLAMKLRTAGSGGAPPPAAPS